MKSHPVLVGMCLAMMIALSSAIAQEATTDPAGLSSKDEGGLTIIEKSTSPDDRPASGADEMNILGVILSMAGTSADDRKKFFSSRTADEQAHIKQRCASLSTVSTSTDATTGPVTTTGTDVMAFCRDIQ